MTSLERVSLTLAHKEADRVPVYPLVNSISRKALGLTYEQWSKDPRKCADAILKITEDLQLDCMCTLVDLSVECADWGQELIFNDELAACPGHNKLIKEVEDYANIGIINPRETPRMSEHIQLARYLYEAKGQEVPVVGFVFGPLGVLSMMRGLEDFFMDLLTDPELIHPALENVTATLKEFCIALLEAGCHAIMLDTLYASQSIMSCTMWEEFEGKYIQEICETIREHGGMVMLHNCGDGVYFEAQIQRMDPILISYQHMPPDCVDMAAIKEKYGSTITLMGHIAPSFLMTATDDSLRALCREQIDAYKKDGGFMLATGCEYTSALDSHFAEVMVEEAHTYGVYTK